jgi:hypothetical protein
LIGLLATNAAAPARWHRQPIPQALAGGGIGFNYQIAEFVGGFAFSPFITCNLVIS